MIGGRRGQRRPLRAWLMAALVPLAIAALLLPRPADAQAPQGDSGSGRLIGRVTALATGLPISGARVRAGEARGLTDAQGTYRLSLPPGRYRLRVTAPGYHGATLVSAELDPLRADGATRLDVALPGTSLSGAAAASVAARLTRDDPSAPGTELAAAAGVERVAAAQAITRTPRSVRVMMPDGRLVTMGMDEYLKGVVPSEMGWVFRRDFEALKAQAIAARTYAATRCLPETAGDPERCEPGLDANVDTTTRTQVWRPVHFDITDAAVEATHGQVARALRGGETEALVEALYFARTVERTVDSENSPCCGGRLWPHLRSVSSPDPFADRRGHGAGMSQEGAAVLSEWGATAEEIVAHYYSGARVRRPAAPHLFDARATPRHVAPGAAITVSVRYRDEDGDPPRIAELQADGRRWTMGLVGEPTTADHREGSLWQVVATLSAGPHALRLRFSDGYSEPVVLEAGSVFVVSAPESAVAPEAAAAPDAAAAPEVASVAEEVAGDGTAGLDAGPRVGRVRAGAVRIGAGLLDTAAVTDAVPAAGVALSAASLDAAAVREAVEGPVIESRFPFMALALRWTERRAEADLRAPVLAQVRTSGDGEAWSPWRDLLPEEDGPSGATMPSRAHVHWTRLLVASGRFAQVRLVPLGRDGSVPAVTGMTFHYLDGTDGPRAPRVPAAARASTDVFAAPGEGQGLGIASLAAAVAPGPAIIPRTDWGADEQLRRDEDGDLIWPATYTQPRAIIVHHTVTANEPTDPAAIVRAIYHFHAVTRGWGDIGYNFLVDGRGNLYEGRAGGEREGRIVQGGHARQFNSNSIGVAVLGTFTAGDQHPTSSAFGSLVELAASRGVRYDIDPQSPVTLAGTRFAHRVMGHRDALPGLTVCPGDGLHGRLGALRTGVTARMAELSPEGTATPGPPPAPTATPRPSATPAATPTTLPQGCQELLRDGGFEQESDAWLRNRAYFTRWDVWRGRTSLFVGLRDNDPDDGRTFASASQWFRVPDNVGAAQLSFGARTLGHEGDARLVRLLDESGAVVALSSTSLAPEAPWERRTLDVGAVLREQAGQRLRIYFGVINDGDGLKSYLRLDEVSLTACAPDGGSATPSPTRSLTATPTADAYPGPPSTPTGGSATAEPGTPGPATCAPLPLEGGFEEEGLPRWRPLGDQPAVRVITPTRTGTGALQLGVVHPAEDAFGFAAATTELRLPRGVVSGTLTLWLRPTTVAPGDRMLVELRRPRDGARRLLLSAEPVGPPGLWTRLELPFSADDVEAFGLHRPSASLLDHQLRFLLGVLNRDAVGTRGEITRLLVDDVAFSVCARPRHTLYLPRALGTR